MFFFQLKFFNFHVVLKYFCHVVTNGLGLLFLFFKSLYGKFDKSRLYIKKCVQGISIQLCTLYTAQYCTGGMNALHDTKISGAPRPLDKRFLWSTYITIPLKTNNDKLKPKPKKKP